VTGLLGLIHREGLCGETTVTGLGLTTHRTGRRWGGHGGWPREDQTQERLCAGEAMATGLGLTTREPGLCKIVHSD
jgi:hypothetical protein